MMQSQKEKVKRKKSKGKSISRDSRLLTFNFWFYLFAFTFLVLNGVAFAKDIIIIYTGDTHAMIYPCSCPREPDGGIARRGTLLKQLKNSYPEALVLDSGSFFSGGLTDEYAQNTELDKQRALVNLKAMELMKYDAVAIGDDEFNFGREFLQENIAKTNLTFLSCNVKFDKLLPYIIKEVSGTRVGIIGVTGPLARQKATGLELFEPKTAVAEAISDLKKNGANIIVLLSRLGADQDLDLINSVPGIDILLTGRSDGKKESSSRIANTLVLRPSWQGRKLDKLSLNIEGSRIINYKVEELRLSDKILDDPQVLSILPRCFSDTNCKKEGSIGVCQDAGSINSSCSFAQANRVSLLIITPKVCRVCDTTVTVDHLKRQFSGLVVSYLYYPDKKADKMIRDLGISSLPAYLLGKEVEKENNFPALKTNLDLKEDFYILKSQLTGVAFFLGRQNQKGKVDLFISLFEKNTPQLLEAIREFNPTVHFLAIQQNNGFDAKTGNLEVEEYLRAVCVQKYYPGNFFDYIACRAKNINSSWWDNCLGDLDADKIRTCAKGSEGSSLLKENISLDKELEILFGPAYLLDNQEVFATQGVPTKEDFEKIFQIKPSKR